MYMGLFDLDEVTYDGTSNITNLNNIKYIAGPVSRYEIVIGVKHISLFGDVHLAAKHFTCGPNKDDANNYNTVYLPDYLEYKFRTVTRPTNLFIELPDNIGEMTDGMLDNIRKKFAKCFGGIVCLSYPLVTFHAMDIRYYDNPTDTINSLYQFNEFITNAIDSLYNKRRYDLRVDAIKRQVGIIGEAVQINTKLTYQNIVTNSTNIIQLTDNVLNFLTTHNIRHFDNSYNKLVEWKTDVMKYQGAVVLPDSAYNFIKTYIGDESGTYADVDDRWWKFVGSSHKLNIDTDNEIVRRFKPDIWNRYLHFVNVYKPNMTADVDCIRNLMQTRSVNMSNYELVQLFCVSYYASMMDIYIIGQMFADDTDAVVVAGDIHVVYIAKFLIEIGAYVMMKVAVDDKEIDYMDVNRCVEL